MSRSSAMLMLEMFELMSKHLPGKHDQSSHTPKRYGRGGGERVGFSVADKKLYDNKYVGDFEVVESSSKYGDEDRLRKLAKDNPDYEFMRARVGDDTGYHVVKVSSKKKLSEMPVVTSKVRVVMERQSLPPGEYDSIVSFDSGSAAMREAAYLAGTDFVDAQSKGYRVVKGSDGKNHVIKLDVPDDLIKPVGIKNIGQVSGKLTAGQAGIDATKQVQRDIDANLEIYGRTDAPDPGGVIQSVADRTGLSYDVAEGYAGAWTESSSKSLSNMAIQQAAAEKFGTGLSDWQKERLNNMLHSRRIGSPHAYTYPGESKPSKSTSMPPKTRDELDVWLGGVYGTTQDYFRANNIDKVTVYRGVGALDPKDYKNGEKVRLSSSNALESWTTDRNVARGWGVVVRADVPADRILGMGTTGIGTLNEREVVVIGNNPDDIVEIVK